MSLRRCLLESLELTELHNAEQCLKTTTSRITQQHTIFSFGFFRPQKQRLVK